MRRLMWALVCITLGAATTVSSVFILTARTPAFTSAPTTSMRQAPSATQYRCVIFVVARCKTRTYAGYSLIQLVAPRPMDIAYEGWDFPPAPMPAEVLPYADAFWASDVASLRRGRIIEMYGWPCLAAYAASDVALDSGVIVAAAGLPVMWWSHPRQFGVPGFPGPFPAILPLRPLWAGFVANSMLFAAAWALAPSFFWFTRTARRRRRAARGRCTSCGYDLKGAPSAACPECGKAAM